MLKGYPLVATVEEHYVDGGLGSLVAEIAAESGTCFRVVRCGVHALDVRTGSVLGSVLWPFGSQIFSVEWLPPLVDPEVTRDFVYVDDVLEAYLLAATVQDQAPDSI